jgi:hypothetical protein
MQGIYLGPITMPPYPELLVYSREEGSSRSSRRIVAYV